MRNRKVLILLVLLVAAIFTACGKENVNVEEGTEVTTVKIGVVGEANEMWTPVIEKLEEEGVHIELISFTDYVTPNKALANGDTDLNAFQHYAYLNSEIENNEYNITAIGDTFISAMNIYSDKFTKVSEIGEESKIAIPNDATNGGRALKVLEASGLIGIDKNAGDSPELSDITSNPLNLEFVEVDAANVFSLLPDVEAGVINCNYALDNGLNPSEDSIFQDNVSFYAGKSYVNLIAARTEDADNEIYKKIVEAYQTEAVKDVYADAFKGAYIAAWDAK
jgi:D-methionine transport system substrate-binding protein